MENKLYGRKTIYIEGVMLIISAMLVMVLKRLGVVGMPRKALKILSV